MTATLSLRQRRIRERGLDSPEIRRQESREIDKTLASFAKGRVDPGRPVSEGPFWSIYLSDEQQRPKPLPWRIQQRMKKVHEFDRRERDRQLAARMARVRAFNPGPIDPIDRQIVSQIRNQPVEFRSTLRFLYDGWIANNARFFSGKLSLPIIVVGGVSKGTEATCSHQKPAIISFNEETLRNKSRRYLLGVITHEQIHQALFERGGGQLAWDEKTGGHHAPFAALCNRIGRELGMPDVYEDVLCGAKAARFWPPKGTSMA